MDITILSNPKTMPSARLIRDEINNNGIRCIVTKLTENINPNTCLVRYGNTSSVPVSREVGNSRDLIKICGNKQLTSDIFSKHKINTPIFYKNPEDVEKFPVLVRTTLTSFGGNGMFVVENNSELFSIFSSDSVWTTWLDLIREYRVHVVDGHVVKIFKKIFNGDGEDDFPIRTSKNYHFSIRNNHEVFGYLLSLIKKVNSAVPLEMVALDIGFDGNTRKYILIEMNSAPGLNVSTAKFYGDHIIKLYGEE